MAGWLVPSPWNSTDITIRDVPDGQVFGMVLVGFSRQFHQSASLPQRLAVHVPSLSVEHQSLAVDSTAH
jgi:hypothetical protein